MVSEIPPSRYSSPSGDIHKVTKSPEPLPNGICRGLCAGTEGTVNIVDREGNLVANFPLQKGYNPILVSHVLVGGTADNIWALY